MRLELLIPLLLAGCPAEGPEDTCLGCLEGELEVIDVPEGLEVPPLDELIGEGWSLDVDADEALGIFADNDERRADLMAFVLGPDLDNPTVIAGPGVTDFTTEYLNAEWGCSFETAGTGPPRPRGCPDSVWVAPSTGRYTVVMVATDGTEDVVGYRVRFTIEGDVLSGFRSDVNLTE